MKERRRKRMERMLDNFIKEFSAHGVDKTTIKMLAKSVNCNEALLYQYFEDKDDMIVQCTEYNYRKIVDRVVKLWAENVLDLEKTGEKTVKYLNSVMDQCGFLIQVMAHPTYSASLQAKRRYRSEQMQEFIDILQKVYVLSEDEALGITLGLNSFMYSYVLHPEKKWFFIQYNTMVNFLQKRVEAA